MLKKFQVKTTEKWGIKMKQQKTLVKKIRVSVNADNMEKLNKTVLSHNLSRSEQIEILVNKYLEDYKKEMKRLI